MVPADSRRIPRVPRYSGYRYAGRNFAKGAVTRCGPTFQTVTLAPARTTARSYNPGTASTAPVWALPRSLATTGGIIVYFLFLRVLRCFSSPRSPHGIAMMTALGRPGCPIRKSAGQGSFAPNRGLSQLITSFIASVSLGIRHTPFFTFFAVLVKSFLTISRAVSYIPALYSFVFFIRFTFVSTCQ